MSTPTDGAELRELTMRILEIIAYHTGRSNTYPGLSLEVGLALTLRQAASLDLPVSAHFLSAGAVKVNVQDVVEEPQGWILRYTAGPTDAEECNRIFSQFQAYFLRD